ncbi:MAG TPA: hypothetical protein VGL58_07535 [Caulobacteraceae bacterium]|jgi:hypothetical protein
MLAKVLDEAWRTHKATADITTSPTFCDAGLVLGAGAILAANQTERRAVDLETGLDRLFALLSVAYGRRVERGLIRHLRRASDCWTHGDRAMAEMHIAVGGLGRVPSPAQSAHRLFLADRLMEAGCPPETVMRAAGLVPSSSDNEQLTKYSQDQPRVPAGSGRTSGRWTNGVDETSPQPSTLSRIGAGAARLLGWVATKATAPTVFFNVLLAPSALNGQGRVIGVPGHPEMKLVLPPGETQWSFQDTSPSGQTTRTRLRPDQGLLLTDEGEVAGRLLPGGAVALDLAVLTPTKFKPDEPKLCPAPQPDKGGSKAHSPARVYEDQIKALVNPEAPTPSGFGVSLPLVSRATGIVTYDDCERATGAMVDAKGPTYDAALLDRSEKYFADAGVVGDMLEQAESQVAAAGHREVRWYFADAGAAAFASKLFADTDRGRDRIEIFVVPYAGDRQ